VFDVAGNILIVDIEAGSIRSRLDIALDEEAPRRRAALLARAGVDVLICGAVSWPMEMAVIAARIEVISQTCGDVEEVIAAYISGRLVPVGFLMPGCCARRRSRARRARQGSAARNTEDAECSAGGTHEHGRQNRRRSERCQQEMERDQWEWEP
jgi:predicted Fe-Mo cluster-binding NifX family protein